MLTPELLEDMGFDVDAQAVIFSDTELTKLVEKLYRFGCNRYALEQKGLSYSERERLNDKEAEIMEEVEKRYQYRLSMMRLQVLN